MINDEKRNESIEHKIDNEVETPIRFAGQEL